MYGRGEQGWNNPGIFPVVTINMAVRKIFSSFTNTPHIQKKIFLITKIFHIMLIEISNLFHIKSCSKFSTYMDWINPHSVNHFSKLEFLRNSNFLLLFTRTKDKFLIFLLYEWKNRKIIRRRYFFTDSFKSTLGCIACKCTYLQWGDFKVFWRWSFYNV